MCILSETNWMKQFRCFSIFSFLYLTEYKNKMKNSPSNNTVEYSQILRVLLTTVEGNGVNLIKLNKHTGTNSHTQSSLGSRGWVEEFLSTQERFENFLSVAVASRLRIFMYILYFLFPSSVIFLSINPLIRQLL